MARNRNTSVFTGCIYALFLLVLMSGAPSAWGQIASQGTINVTVVDQSGAVIPGANLSLEDLASNNVRTAVTGANGVYSFVSLSIGTYKLTVNKTGMQGQVFESVAVQATRTTDVHVSLSVGAQTAVVEVIEQTPVVERTSNAITGTIDLEQVEELPVVGRDISQLSRLVPGAVSNGGQTTWNGMPLAATGNNIDGVIATTSRMKFGGASQPLVEARIEDMQEMTVQTDQLNTNTGFGQSNFQVNFVTRRGSNTFHGRLFEDHRNSALNANSWVNDAGGADKPKFHLNDFGGSISGAAIKNKLFFFGTFAMSKQPGSYITGGTQFPTQAAQAGNFTWTDSSGTHTINLLTDVAGPAGQPSTVNAVTTGLFNNINGSLSGGTVTPTALPYIDNIVFPVQSPITYWLPTVRADYNIKDNLRMYMSWNMTKWKQPGAGAPPFPGAAFKTYGASNQYEYFTAALGFDWTIKPTIVNQFRGGYLFNLAKYSYDASKGYLQLPEIDWPTSVGTSGQVYNNLPIQTYYPLVNAADNVSWQLHKHLLNFGFSYYREQDHYNNAPAGFPFDAIGLVGDDPATTAFENYFATHFPNATTTDRSNAEDLYSVLRGRISGVSPGGSGFPYDVKAGKYSTTVSGYNLNELQSAWGLFFEDAWRVKSDLTVNLGLRWDFTGDDHDKTGAYHSADPVGIWGPSGVNNIFKPGVLTSDPAGLNPTYVGRVHVYKPWNVSPQPSIGLAWNPTYSDGLMGKMFKGGKTVVRAGFALRRFTEPYQFFWNSASNSGYAFYQAFNLSPVTPGAPLPSTGGYYAGSYELGNAQPTPYTLSPATYQNVIPESNETFFGYWTGVNGINPNIRQPYVESWNLGIQREIGHSNVIEVRYQGNRSVHQWVKLNPNEVNVFENGFLAEFKLAQQNLIAYKTANPNCGQPMNPPCSFANNGLPGQSPLPILTAAFTNPGGLDPAGFSNGAFLSDLKNGQAGDFASSMAGSSTYLCNLVGSASFSPCALNGVANPGHGYPINFFQANPYNAGKATGYLTDPGFGDYHALQVDWRQKQWHGMQFDANYAWSHTLGVQPGNTWTGTTRLFTMRNLRQSYGPTLFDARHVFHVNGTYDLPFGKGKTMANRGGAVDRVVGGWSIGTILTYQTGLPSQLIGGYRTTNGPASTPFGDGPRGFDLGDGGVVLTGITVSQLQNSVGVFSAPGQTYAFGFDPTKRAMISPNTVAGTSSGNPYIYGPHEFFQDMAITKVFRIRENLRFSFQTEFENVWNHPVWNTPNTQVQSSNFGHSGVIRTFLNGLLIQGERQIGFRANIEF